MTVTVSVVLALSAITYVLCRYAGLRIAHALVCIVLGFYLASSTFAPDISKITQSLFHLL